MNKVRTAIIQLRVEGNEMEKNLDNAAKKIAEAAANKALIAVLPECMDLGWTHPASLLNATTIPDGTAFRRLKQIAMDNNIYVCAGITEKEGKKVYNTAILISRKGNLLLKHRKINELDIGKPYYSTGNHLNVVNTEYGRIGVVICADALVEDRSILTAIARMEPDVILSPCAWAVPPGFDNSIVPYGNLWRDAYVPVAKKFSTYILGVSNVGKMVDGPWKGWDCIGASLAIDNQGEEILQCPFGVNAETIRYIDVVRNREMCN